MLPPDESPSQHFTALRRTLNHAARHSPYYRDQAWAARLRSGQAVSLQDIPITAKEAVRDKAAAFHAAMVPEEDRPVYEKHTSGSTGLALDVRKTERHFVMNRAENARLKAGWGFERHRRRVQVGTPGDNPPGETVTERKTASGGTEWKIYSFEAAPNIELLRRVRPTLWTTRASLALAIFRDCPDINFVRLICTLAEMIPPEWPALMARFPQTQHFDLYGAVETGIIAGLCKSCGRYHVAQRHLWVELLDDNDRPVDHGEVGRVVLTPLHNLAMPLIRYDIGDYAMRARRDACDGSGLALRRIMGRRRDLFKLPLGGLTIPFPRQEDMKKAGIRQLKLVQTAIDEVEVRYVPYNPATEVALAAAQRIVDNAVAPQLRAKPVKVAELPMRVDAKYFLHESLI